MNGGQEKRRKGAGIVSSFFIFLLTPHRYGGKTLALCPTHIYMFYRDEKKVLQRKGKFGRGDDVEGG